jgi:hypothetical protein
MDKTNKNPFCFWLCLLIGMICSAQAHSTNQHDIQQIRSLSYSVLVNVLMYYNPNGTPYDLGTAETYQADLQLLLRKTKQLGMPEAAVQAERLSATIADLRHLPQSRADIRDVTPPYSLWLPQVIEQQTLLNALLSDLYERQTATSELQRTLHQMSWDIEQLLLSYQISTFPGLVAQAWILDERTVAALDTSIQTRFEELSANPELASSLGRLSVYYQSIRHNLLDPATNWSPSTVARYLLTAARQLDSLAENVNGP